MTRFVVRIDESPFDPAQELAAFEGVPGEAGAVVAFVGKVRAEAGDNPVRALYLEHYPGVTERLIAEFAAEARKRWTLLDGLIIHRVGELTPGESIVMVCASAAHRREAFEAADFLMDYLKTKALFWKKEIREASDAWIEPREQDYEDAARWSD